jgi:hypothetical protein
MLTPKLNHNECKSAEGVRECVLVCSLTCDYLCTAVNTVNSHYLMAT